MRKQKVTLILFMILFGLVQFGWSDVIISEMCDPQSEYAKNRFIEIYNTGSSSVDLTGWKVEAITNDGSNIAFTWNLSGSITSGDALVCGDDGNTLITCDFAEADWSSSNSSWNGQTDDGAKLLDGTTLIDNAASHGNFENKTATRAATVESAVTTFASGEWSSTATTNYESASPGSHTSNYPAGAVNNPTSLSASVQSTAQIDLSWTDNTAADNVLLAWNSTSTFGTPTNGQTYSADDAISGGGTVLQYNATESYSHSSLTGNTAYYYKAWSYDGSTYSSGATTDATTLKIEPTNHPTSLSAASSYQSIQITWTDAVAGSQAPDGYLILGETVASITDPSDGTAESDDTDAAGNAVAKNVTHGSGGSYTFNSLTASTTWYFEVFPYTNSGTDIDYKLNGTIPTANATTGVAPVFVINEIHADPDATNGDANGDAIVSTSNDEFVEIVNRSGYSVDISNWVISDGFRDRHTVTNGTTIGNGVALIVFGGGTPTNISGIAQTASSGGLGLNNAGDDVTLKDSEGGIIVTYSYGSEGDDNQSIARNPDYTGDFVKHSTITGNAVLFSPGKTNATDSSLPVELSSFAANTARSNEITLTWVTESEIENLGFILDRRDAESESQEWIQIASYQTNSAMVGQGSSSERTEYSYIDEAIEPGMVYEYRLADVSYQGAFEYHTMTVLATTSALELPSEYTLHQNYPNPFNPSTTISYSLPEQSNVKLTFFDIQGREIMTLQDASQIPGSYEVQWNGMDQQGNHVSTGVYFARLQAGAYSKTIKMLYLK